MVDRQIWDEYVNQLGKAGIRLNQALEHIQDETESEWGKNGI